MADDKSSETQASFFSKATFAWILPFYSVAVELGSKLSLSDLHEIPECEKPKQHISEFNAVFKVDAEGNIAQGKTLASALWDLIGNDIALSALMINVGALSGFINPFLISVLVEVVEGKHELWVGILVGIGIWAVMILVQSMVQNAWHIGTRASRKALSAFSCYLYRKPSLMTSKEASKFEDGEVINFMSTDCQTLVQVIQLFNLFAIIPSLVICATALLLVRLGAIVLVAVVIMTANAFIADAIGKSVQSHQVKKNQLADMRTSLMNEALQGIRTVKLNAWENVIIKRVLKHRDQEIVEMRSINLLRALQFFLANAVPTLSMVVTFVLYVVISNGTLDPAGVFYCVPLFLTLNIALVITPNMINEYRRLLVSLDRLEKYFSAPNDYVERAMDNDDGVVELEGVSFSWGKPREKEQNSQSETQKAEPSSISPKDVAFEVADASAMLAGPTLENISFSARRGDLIVVVGKVASGKSTLCNGLLGLLDQSAGKKCVNGKLAYVAQSAFIMNDTIRNNITFGNGYDEAAYKACIRASQLIPDLKTFEDGDLMSVGEKGVTLSGGQRQRVSIARAAFADATVYLFDDPLSALDSHCAAEVMGKVVNKLCREEKTVILFTNQIQFAVHATKILVLKDRTIVQQGTYEELMRDPHGEFFSLASVQVGSGTRNSAETEDEDHEDQKNEQGPNDGEEENGDFCSLSANSNPNSDTEQAIVKKPSLQKLESIDLNKDEGMESRIKANEEKKDTGRLGFGTVHNMAVEGETEVLFYAAVALGFAVPLCQFFSTFWLAKWSEESTTSLSFTGNFLWYIVITIIFAILVALQTIVTNEFFLLSSRRLHDKMLENLLHAPMSFFDTTPVGRVLNRFSQDVMALDIMLPRMTEMWSDNVGKFLSGTIPAVVLIPPFIVVVIPLFWVASKAYSAYGAVALELQRLYAISISPILASFSAFLQGLDTIRAFGKTQFFNTKFDKNQSKLVATNYWLFALDRMLFNLIGGVVVGGFIAVIAIGLVLLRDVTILEYDIVTPGVAGLLLAYTMELNFRVPGVFYATTAVERLLISQERILEYCKIDRELSVSAAIGNGSKTNGVPKEWPKNGADIVVDKVEMAYREGLPLVLKGLSVKFQGGSKIGIVGRTGAGKSSIVLALFRMMELLGGGITVDGRDITSVPLEILRSRIAMIPQDPFVLSGSLRMNLSLGGDYTDEILWEVLRKVSLEETVKSLEGQLDHEIQEKGDNLSAGTVQLLCLARVLLRNPSVVVMDEATSSVDVKTDVTVQETIRQVLKDATVIVIAHRINTIIDFDSIAVLDDGKIAEFGPAADLLENKEGLFHKLVKSTGKESYEELSAKARAARKKRS